MPRFNWDDYSLDWSNFWLTVFESGAFLHTSEAESPANSTSYTYTLHPFKSITRLGKKNNVFDLYIVFSTLLSSLPFSTTHILPWYQSYSEALCSSHNYAAVTFSIQLYSFIRKQGNINICFFILIIQRSDKTIALRSNFNFAFGSQHMSGQLFVILSYKN